MHIIPLTTASFWCEASPEGATQESPGREPWVRMKLKKEALKGRSSCIGKMKAPKNNDCGNWHVLLCRPFRASCNGDLEPRAYALGFPAGPFRGPEFRDRN